MTHAECSFKMAGARKAVLTFFFPCSITVVISQSYFQRTCLPFCILQGKAVPSSDSSAALANPFFSASCLLLTCSFTNVWEAALQRRQHSGFHFVLANSGNGSCYYKDVARKLLKLWLEVWKLKSNMWPPRQNPWRTEKLPNFWQGKIAA